MGRRKKISRLYHLGNFQSIGEILARFDSLKDKYISREFQKYGYDLAVFLGDIRHKALYIKMAKEVPRAVLEEAKNFVKDANNVKSRARLFMWRVKFLREEQRANPVSRRRDLRGGN